jgi:predicted lipoprotein with Yx(FWY)xxD motif
MNIGRTGKLLTPALLLAAVVALVAAGCGGSNNDNGSSNASSTTTSGAQSSRYGSQPASSTSGTLAVGKTDLGTILVGAKGRTLYLFEKDKGPKSTCSGACAAVWMPFTTSSSQVKTASGVDTAKVTTSKRSDGTLQVVYADHPLYYYAPDTKAGQTTGEGLDQFGAEWYVVSPSGQKVEKSGKS